jgi:magnesium transporter
MDKLEFAAEFVEDLPNSAARSLENLRAEDVSAFVDQIPDPLSSKALRHMLPQHAAQCLQPLPVASSVRYLAPLPISSIAMVLRHLPQPQRQEIIDGLPNNAARRIRRLLNYPRTVVGSWTNVDAVALPGECTIAEALRRVRGDASDLPSEVFVVDQDQRLIGEVWTGWLAEEAADKRLDEVLKPAAHVLSATMSIQAAMGDEGWKESDILPVVDRSELFMGTLRYFALRRALAGILVDQPESKSGGAVLGITDAWFSGLATILEAILARTSDGSSAP